MADTSNDQKANTSNDQQADTPISEKFDKAHRLIFDEKMIGKSLSELNFVDVNHKLATVKVESLLKPNFVVQNKSLECDLFIKLDNGEYVLGESECEALRKRHVAKYAGYYHAMCFYQELNPNTKVSEAVQAIKPGKIHLCVIYSYTVPKFVSPGRFDFFTVHPLNVFLSDFSPFDKIEQLNAIDEKLNSTGGEFNFQCYLGLIFIMGAGEFDDEAYARSLKIIASHSNFFIPIQRDTQYLAILELLYGKHILKKGEETMLSTPLADYVENLVDKAEAKGKAEAEAMAQAKAEEARAEAEAMAKAEAKKAAKAQKEEIARNLIRAGVAQGVVIASTKLSSERVQELIKEIDSE
jgi:hypothetical protein